MVRRTNGSRYPQELARSYVEWLRLSRMVAAQEASTSAVEELLRIGPDPAREAESTIPPIEWMALHERCGIAIGGIVAPSEWVLFMSELASFEVLERHYQLQEDRWSSGLRDGETISSHRVARTSLFLGHSGSQGRAIGCPALYEWIFQVLEIL